VWLFAPHAVAVGAIPSAAVRRMLMGLAMGVTAVLIIHSPAGKRSGAHFNPAITLTYLRLRKIAALDAVFYIVGQFIGAVAGVGLAAAVLPHSLAEPPVQYAITVPGREGVWAAFAAELGMAALLMGVVLWVTNHLRWAKYSSGFVGVLIAFYILLFAPVSGFSINPARTFGSALFAHMWTAAWIYFIAPMLGMFAAAEVYVRLRGQHTIRHASLHPNPVERGR
jgi:aquaporin Z